MATLNLRNLPDDVHRILRMRAARAGRSTEAEARAILAEVCRRDEGALSAEDLQLFVDELYPEGKPLGVVDDLLAERRAEASRE